MRVYAEYFKESGGKEYRKKTLLHFGNSTELIGSAVLINPGSAKPIGEPDTEFIKSFYSINHPTSKIDIDNWKTFSKDPTMDQLEKIFNGWYIGEKKELNGVIQLFNCFYFKNKDLNEAIKNFNEISTYNFNEFQFFLDKPVYFGWGGAGKYGNINLIATDIFSKYNLSNTPIYDTKFQNNCFYHPGYVNRSYRLNSKTKKLMKKFFNSLS
ncbi:MAG TPA: hypothetical protein VGK10_14575 [Prolixibacteraceae bacterium]|jgi:hypothetical protein